MSESNNFLVSATNAYSQALYELAVEEKSLNDIENQVIGVIKLISNSTTILNNHSKYSK